LKICFREKPSKDFQKIWCIKSDGKKVLTNDEDVKKRWREYFERYFERYFEIK